jgi:anti-sigma factor RsiW
MVHASGHVDIAAYILGALDEPDNTAFEEHLLDCPRCQLDLVELQDVPDLLDAVKHDAPALLVPVPGPQVLTSLLEEASRSRIRRRRRQWIGAVAAGFLIVAAPTVTIVLTSGDPSPAIASPPVNVKIEPSSAPQSSEEPHVLNGVGGEMEANMTMLAHDWGTQIDIELRGAIGPRTCELVAISSRGATETVTNWTVPKGGRNAPLKLSGGTSFLPGDITRLEVRDDAGQILLSLTG